MGFSSRSVAFGALLAWFLQNFAHGLIQRHRTSLRKVLGALLRRWKGGLREVLEALLHRLEDTRRQRNQIGGRHLGAIIAASVNSGRATKGRSGTGNGHIGSFSASGGLGRGVVNLQRQDRPGKGGGGRKPELWQAAEDRPGKGGGGRKPELWQAAEDGDIIALTRLLHMGRRVDEPYKGWTPLMKASEEGNSEIVVALLKARADMEARNRNGRTALSFAATPSMGRKASVAVVQLLLEAGASLEHQDARGETARDRAVRDGYQESVDRIDAFVEQRAVQMAMRKQIDARIDTFVERRIQAFGWSASPPQTSTPISEIECQEALSRSTSWSALAQLPATPRSPPTPSQALSQSASWPAHAQLPATPRSPPTLLQAASPVAPELEEVVFEPSPNSPKSAPASPTLAPAPASPTLAPQSASPAESLSTADEPKVPATVRKDVGWGAENDMPISFAESRRPSRMLSEQPVIRARSSQAPPTPFPTLSAEEESRRPSRKFSAHPMIGVRSSQAPLTPFPPLSAEKEARTCCASTSDSPCVMS
eukprot:TRINITY_DN15071_c0_g2_i1.p1 TRINITY_DN15071_c0_g2~~TRINITY_DN15071_c0_g2_i1.p1  ORF type:complete len:538 (-),score=104.66 TRINITY_DN15071_c0_g2_i1:94-1707(-)